MADRPAHIPALRASMTVCVDGDLYEEIVRLVAETGVTRHRVLGLAVRRGLAGLTADDVRADTRPLRRTG